MEILALFCHFVSEWAQGAKYGWQQFLANLEQVLARTD
jgi:hypothetical protein